VLFLAIPLLPHHANPLKEIGKPLALCESVYERIREELPSWSHPSGTFTLFCDAAHATLPYLASAQEFHSKRLQP